MKHTLPTAIKHSLACEKCLDYSSGFVKLSALVRLEMLVGMTSFHPQFFEKVVAFSAQLFRYFLELPYQTDPFRSLSLELVNKYAMPSFLAPC